MFVVHANMNEQPKCAEERLRNAGEPPGGQGLISAASVSYMRDWPRERARRPRKRSDGVDGGWN